MNMTIDELVDNFSLFEDWEDRYRYLIDLGGALPPMDDALKTATTKVQGCMSQVWMRLFWQGGILKIESDSDAQIVRGLIAVLIVIYQDKTADDIRQIAIEDIFGKLGMDQHLSPNRRNGFYSMVERIKSFVA